MPGGVRTNYYRLTGAAMIAQICRTQYGGGLGLETSTVDDIVFTQSLMLVGVEQNPASKVINSFCTLKCHLSLDQLQFSWIVFLVIVTLLFLGQQWSDNADDRLLTVSSSCHSCHSCCCCCCSCSAAPHLSPVALRLLQG